jgi:CDP-diglyceride synthetase
VPDASAPVGRGRRWLRSHLARKQATHGIYIEIVVLAIILALEGKRATDGEIVVAVLGVIVAVVLADLYAYYIGTMIGASRRPTMAEMKVVARGEMAAVVAAIPPVFLLMLGVGGVIRLDAGFDAAKWAGVTVIGLYALVASRRAGLTTRQSLGHAAVFTLLGVGLVLLKQYIH